MKRIALALCVLLLLFGVMLFVRQHSTIFPQKPPQFVLGTYRWFDLEEEASLILEADGAFTSTKHTDVGPSNDPSRTHRGTFWLEGKKVTLVDSNSEPPQYIYYIVPWDKRMYLVPEAKIPEFARAIQAGLEPRPKRGMSAYFLRDIEGGSNPKGLPEFPEKWQSLLKGVTPVELDIPIGVGYVARVSHAANKASKTGQGKKAVRYAQEVLKRATGNDYHHEAFLVLGLAELRAGKIASAKEYLHKARAIIPTVSSGPYQEFLQGLCLKGERQAVLEYVDARAKKLSEPERTKLWRQQVMENKIPKLFEPEEGPE